MSEQKADIAAGIVEPGEYAPAGEAQGVAAVFSPDAVASAFGVDRSRVEAAMQGELSLGPDAAVSSRQAQDLAEALLADQPLDQRQAALMKLGAYTPRADHDWGVGEAAPGEESDKAIDNTRSPADKAHD